MPAVVVGGGGAASGELRGADPGKRKTEPIRGDTDGKRGRDGAATSSDATSGDGRKESLAGGSEGTRCLLLESWIEGGADDDDDDGCWAAPAETRQDRHSVFLETALPRRRDAVETAVT